MEEDDLYGKGILIVFDENARKMKIEQVKMEDSNDGKKRKSTILNMQIEKSGEIWTEIDEK